MKKEEIAAFQKEIHYLNELLDKLYGYKTPEELSDYSTEFKKRKFLLGKKLPKSTENLPYIEQKIVNRYEELVAEFESFLRGIKDEEEQKTSTQSITKNFQVQETDYETASKEKELQTMREMNLLTSELNMKQQHINSKIKEHGEMIDEIYDDSERTVEQSKGTVKELAGASKQERSRRLRNFQVGGTIVGAIFGKFIGAAVGLFATKGASKAIAKTHDKKLDKLVNDDD